MDYVSRKFWNLFLLLGNSMNKHLDYIQERAEFFNDIGHTVLELAEQQLHETSTIQCRQNAMLEIMIQLVSQGLLQPAMGKETREGLDTWNDVIRKEAEAMQEAQDARLKLLQHMRHQVDIFQKSKAELLDDGDKECWQKVHTDLRALQEELDLCLAESDLEDNLRYAMPSEDVEMDELNEEEPDIPIKLEVSNVNINLTVLAEIEVPEEIMGTIVDLTTGLLDTIQQPASAPEAPPPTSNSTLLNTVYITPTLLVVPPLLGSAAPSHCAQSVVCTLLDTTTNVPADLTSGAFSQPVEQ